MNPSRWSRLRRPAAAVVTAALLGALAPGAALADVDGTDTSGTTQTVPSTDPVPVDDTAQAPVQSSSTSTDPTSTSTDPMPTDDDSDSSPAQEPTSSDDSAQHQQQSTSDDNSQSPQQQSTSSTPTTTPTDPSPVATDPNPGTSTNTPTAPTTSAGDAGDEGDEGTEWNGYRILGLVDGRVVAGSTLTLVPVGLPAGADIEIAWVVLGASDYGVGPTFTVPSDAAGLMLQLSTHVIGTADYRNGPVGEIASTATRPSLTVPTKEYTTAEGATVSVGLSYGLDRLALPDDAGTVVFTLDLPGDEPRHYISYPAEIHDGVASVNFGPLAAGDWIVTASFTPFDAGVWAAAGEVGSLLVSQVVVAPGVSVVSAFSVPVASPVKFTAQVSGDTIPAGWRLYEGSTLLGSGMVSWDGRVEVSVPALTPGVHQLQLVLPTGSASALTADIQVTVTGEPTRDGATPSADLASPHKATVPGQSMDLVAKGFQEGETVAFYLHSDPVFLGTAVADADGIARLTAVIPADAPEGAHSVVATGGTSGLWATLAVTLGTVTTEPPVDETPVDETPVDTDDETVVTTPVSNPVSVTPAVTTTAAATSPALAITGARSGALALGAALLLALGGGLVLTTRRLRTQR